MKRAGKLFLRRFLKSSLIILFILFIGMISYRAVTKLFHIPDNEVVIAFRTQTKESTITKASLDDVSKNLIYCWDEENGEITKILLEIFHCDDGKLYYITIPVRAQVTISASLYKKLTLINPSMPQVMKLSTLSSYIPETMVFDYGVLVLEEVLGLPISYYSVLPQKLYNTMFVSEKMVEAFSDDYVTFLHTITTEKALEDYLTEVYDKIDSNLTLRDKMNYVDSYRKLRLEDITFELIPGEDKNSGYYIDLTQAFGLLTGYVEGNEDRRN